MAFMPMESPLVTKSYAFSLRMISFCEILRKAKQFILCDQLLSSGTSIGANIEEATQGQTKPDFISKLSIALKEAHETRYWLRLIRDAKITTQSESAEKLIGDVHEIIRMLVASLKTSRSR